MNVFSEIHISILVNELEKIILLKLGVGFVIRVIIVGMKVIIISYFQIKNYDIVFNHFINNVLNNM